MSVTLGRVELEVLSNRGVEQTKEAPDFFGPTGSGRPADGPIASRVYSLRGVEVGASAEATALLLEREGARRGDVYVSETNDLVPAGYYKVVVVDHDASTPAIRPWNATIRRQTEPTVWRQAEDDNVAGTDTTDSTATEGVAVEVSADTATLLDPRNVSGAEPLNLPAGTWRVQARVQAIAAAPPGSPTYATVSCLLTDLAGSTIAAIQSEDVEVFNEWTEVGIGDFEVAEDEAGANWYKGGVTVGDADDVRVDRYRFTRVS